MSYSQGTILFVLFSVGNMQCSGISWTQGSLHVLPVCEWLENEEKKESKRKWAAVPELSCRALQDLPTHPAVPACSGFSVQGFSKLCQDQLWCFLLLLFRF